MKISTFYFKSGEGRQSCLHGIKPLVIASLFGLFSSLCFASPTATDCTSLVGPLSPPDGAAIAKIETASVESVGRFGEAVNHCKIEGYVDFSGLDQSRVHFRLRLPFTTWNHKLFMAGQGGLGGTLGEAETFDDIYTRINDTQKQSALSRGYATVTTDTGHARPADGSGSWALSNPPAPGFQSEVEINYSVRGVHLTALAAKNIIQQFYGQKPNYSYFAGCSRAGYEGISEASNYPTDFDGVISGAPATSFKRLLNTTTNVVKNINPLSNPITEGQAAMITAKVLAKCDLLDGVNDKLISRPEKCKFKPLKDLPLCNSAVNDTCVTLEQATALDQLYNSDKVPGEDPDYVDLMPGGENYGYDAVAADQQFRGYIDDTFLAGDSSASFDVDNLYKYFVFDNATFDSFAHVYSASRKNLEKELKSLGLVNSSFDLLPTDWSAFNKRKGKLLMYHGWIDELIPPKGTISFVNQVLKDTKIKKQDDNGEFLRLYMIPGMGHCEIGPGPQSFKGVIALEKWVEQGIAPQALEAASLEFLYLPDQPTRFGLLCPYPQVSKIIDPQGNIYSAANYRCVDQDKDHEE